MFARSRSIVQWSAAAEKIFETTVSIRSFNFKEKLVHELLNIWLPSMNHSTNSSTFNKKLAASQLAKKTQNSRDLWIRKLYGLVHQLNASSETVVNTGNLDNIY